MQKSKRWMETLLKESADVEVTMPWARGARRAEMIARRKALTTEQGKTARA